MSFEHEVELPDIGEVGFAAARAGDLLLPDVSHQTVVVHGLHIDVLNAVGSEVALNELIRPVPHFAGLAVNQRIVEGIDMARGHPDLGIHQDGSVLTHIVRTLLDKLLPPGPLHIVFQLHTQRAIVPGVGQPTVNFRAGKYKAPIFAQGYNLLHGFIRIFQHIGSLLQAVIIFSNLRTYYIGNLEGNQLFSGIFPAREAELTTMCHALFQGGAARYSQRLQNGVRLHNKRGCFFPISCYNT